MMDSAKTSSLSFMTNLRRWFTMVSRTYGELSALLLRFAVRRRSLPTTRTNMEVGSKGNVTTVYASLSVYSDLARILLPASGFKTI